MTVYLSDPDFVLHQGDALEVLRTLPDESVHMCVTSPPFYGLRDYGTGTWQGGDAECDHKASTGEPRKFTNGRGEGTDDEFAGSNLRSWTTRDGTTYRDTCGKCGATRIDRQIGLEETPEQWVQKLVEVFREVKRVLRRDGTLWLEVGDSYASNPAKGGSGPGTRNSPYGRDSRPRGRLEGGTQTVDVSLGGNGAPGCKPKDLIGAPWLLAFALRADGWYLRSDIVWSRPNPMPESVTDRPTKSHSYVFLLSRSARYFFDQEAVREPLNLAGALRGTSRRKDGDGTGDGRHGRLSSYVPARDTPDAGRNIRSVWTIPTQPYPEAHFATYPEELVRRCILAGTSERGCCPECGAPWVREVETEVRDVPGGSKHGAGTNTKGLAGGGRVNERAQLAVTTLGWHPSCECSQHDAFVPIPCTVLDPFSGSGTTALVARKHGRKCIGIELSADYCALTARRLQQLSLLAEAAQDTEPVQRAPQRVGFRTGKAYVNQRGVQKNS